MKCYFIISYEMRAYNTIITFFKITMFIKTVVTVQQFNFKLYRHDGLPFPFRGLLHSPCS